MARVATTGNEARVAEWKGPRYRALAFRRPLARDLRRAVTHRAHLFFSVLLSREFYTCTAVSVTSTVASQGGRFSISTSRLEWASSLFLALFTRERSFDRFHSPWSRHLSPISFPQHGTNVDLVGERHYANLMTPLRGKLFRDAEAGKWGGFERCFITSFIMEVIRDTGNQYRFFLECNFFSKHL